MRGRAIGLYNMGSLGGRTLSGITVGFGAGLLFGWGQVDLHLPEERLRIGDLLGVFPLRRETKMQKLLDGLGTLWRQNPGEKIVIFATYLGTVEMIADDAGGPPVRWTTSIPPTAMHSFDGRRNRLVWYLSYTVAIRRPPRRRQKRYHLDYVIRVAPEVASRIDG